MSEFLDESGTAVRLTPPGGGAIAVVRLRGPRVAEFLESHFSRPAAVNRCIHGILSDGPREIDDPVVVLLSDGRGVDINLHGGPWIIQSVFDLARRWGFIVIDPPRSPLPLEIVDGESEIEREMLSHLPLARTELGVRALLAQPTAWRAFEASVEAATPRAIAQVLADRGLWHLLHPPRVAIVGAANVGKSTLANQLFAQDRSITADLAGTTRDWVGEIADVNGLPVMLVDTPGIRATTDEIERKAIQQSRAQIATADLIVLVLDGSRPLDPEQSPLLGEFAGALRVVNKSDRGAAWDLAQIDAMATVATTGSGIDALRKRIAAHFGCDEFDVARMRWWTQRQREELERGALK